MIGTFDQKGSNRGT